MVSRFCSWWEDIRKYWVVIIIITLVAIGVTIFLGYWFKWDWTGFNEHIGPNVQQYQPVKTLWDWLSLLGVLAIPVVVGIGAAWYTAQQGKVSDRENTDNQRETVLQAYIDKMSELLLEKDLRKSQPGDEVRTIARVRTITVLFQLDARRIGYIFAFLREAELMSTKPNSNIVSLSGANLSKINLSGADLTGANLSRANLSRAFLEGTNLSGADLTGASLYKDNLTGASLAEADLTGADLTRANLTGTNLYKADLTGASLGEANLTGADFEGAILREADLSGATVAAEELEKQAKLLAGATMPDGSKHP